MGWSFSSLELYEKCPQWWKRKYIDRMKEPPREAGPAERGTELHNCMENFFYAKAPLPENLTYMQPKVDAWKAQKAIAEEEWGFDRDWKITPWATAWLRMKLDVAVPSIGMVIDYKSGKKDGNEVKHARQGLLYAVGTQIRYPELDKVTVRFEYLDHQKTSERVWRLPQLIAAKETFNRQALQIEADTEHRPNPQKWKCMYCPFPCDSRAEI